MPTIPNIGAMTEAAKNPLATPSPTDLLMAAATTASMADANKPKDRTGPFGSGKGQEESPIRNKSLVVPMPKTVFDKQDWDKYESVVDEFIAKNKLNEGDTFTVPHPDKEIHYKYLGKDSGGRKDWMEAPPPRPEMM